MKGRFEDDLKAFLELQLEGRHEKRRDYVSRLRSEGVEGRWIE